MEDVLQSTAFPQASLAEGSFSSTTTYIDHSASRGTSGFGADNTPMSDLEIADYNRALLEREAAEAATVAEDEALIAADEGALLVEGEAAEAAAVLGPFGWIADAALAVAAAGTMLALLEVQREMDRLTLDMPPTKTSPVTPKPKPTPTTPTIPPKVIQPTQPSPPRVLSGGSVLDAFRRKRKNNFSFLF